MAAQFKIDLIEGGELSKDLDLKSGRIQKAASRIALVYGLADGSDRASATALIRARALVEAAYPLGLPYDPLEPGLILISHRNEGIAADSGAARVRLSYSSLPFGEQNPGSGASTWTVEDDDYVQMEDSQLDPKSGKPLNLNWTSPDGKYNTGPILLTLSRPQTVERYVLSGIIRKDRLPKLRHIKGRLNDARWGGLPRGYWRCPRFSTTTLVGAKFSQARIEIETKRDRDWAVEGLLLDPRDGRYKADPAAVADVHKASYEFGAIIPKNKGVAKVGFYTFANFGDLLGVDDLDDL
jgi:hypothetical protein